MRLFEEDHISKKSLYKFKGYGAKRLMKDISDKMTKENYFERFSETFVKTVHD